jgi:hypothetical protein
MIPLELKMHAFSFTRTLAVLLLTATTARAELMNYGTDDGDDTALVSMEDLASCGCENTSGMSLGNESSIFFSATSMSSNGSGYGGSLTLPSGTSITAKNNYDCLTGLDVSVSTVLDSNPELPGLYYGEDAENGWICVSGDALEFRFEALGSDGLPYAADVYIDEVLLANITYPPVYENRPIAVIYEDRVYCGTISESGVYMTAVPEPSVGILLMVATALLALTRARRPRVTEA